MQTQDAIMTTQGVVMIDKDIVDSVQALASMGLSSRRIATQLGISRNTVKRYLDGAAPQVQQRPNARRLEPHELERAQQLYRTTAEGNAVVVHELLVESGVDVSLRSVQRALEPLRQQQLVTELATVRFETPPGHQLQIDFGERMVRVAGELLRVYFFVATLCFSRRIFVRASLSQRQDEWKLGLDSALRRFGGRPEVVVVDNARALITHHGRDRVEVHPAFAAFCADRGLSVYACKPYRARTKGKVESGVKYVKRNAIAGREFVGVDALEAHLQRWMDKADQRIHGTTQQQPIVAFREHEAGALRALHEPTLAVATQRLKRHVANDCYVAVDTVRYSVPHRLARTTVEVLQSEHEVVVWHGQLEVARHRRGREPHTTITDPEHFAGLLRPKATSPSATPASSDHSGCDPSPLGTYGRSLEQYAQIVGGRP